MFKGYSDMPNEFLSKNIDDDIEVVIKPYQVDCFPNDYNDQYRRNIVAFSKAKWLVSKKL